MNKCIVAGIALTLGAVIIPVSAGQYELLLSGPVESVDPGTNKVTILGHEYAVRDASAFLAGHKINVFGGIGANGIISAAILQDTNVYAASGDQVIVTGRVNAIDRLRGRVLIDGASVDYTALLAQSQFALPAVGDAVRVAGTQPAGKGMIFASEIRTPAGVSGNSQAVGVSGNSFVSRLGVSGNSQAVGVSGNSFLSRLGVSGNSQAVGVSGNSFMSRLGVSGNSFMSRLGVSGNSFMSRLGVSGNSFVSKLGVSGNSQAVGVSGNSFASR